MWILFFYILPMISLLTIDYIYYRRLVKSDRTIGDFIYKMEYEHDCPLFLVFIPIANLIILVAIILYAMFSPIWNKYLKPFYKNNIENIKI